MGDRSSNLRAGPGEQAAEGTECSDNGVGSDEESQIMKRSGRHCRAAVPMLVGVLSGREDYQTASQHDGLL
jgi:hypothetical protein